MIMEINKQIKILIEELTGNNIPPTRCKITKAYGDLNLCDIETPYGNYTMINSNQHAGVGDTGVLIFLDGDMSKPYVLVDKRGSGVMMVGSFRIDDDGDLVVNLPTGTVNPYYINDQGYLLYDTEA